MLMFVVESKNNHKIPIVELPIVTELQIISLWEARRLVRFTFIYIFQNQEERREDSEEEEKNGEEERMRNTKKIRREESSNEGEIFVMIGLHKHFFLSTI